jgi:hypothetical protein
VSASDLMLVREPYGAFARGGIPVVFVRITRFAASLDTPAMLGAPGPR